MRFLSWEDGQVVVIVVVRDFEVADSTVNNSNKNNNGDVLLSARNHAVYK